MNGIESRQYIDYKTFSTSLGIYILTNLSFIQVIILSCSIISFKCSCYVLCDVAEALVSSEYILDSPSSVTSK